jgi:hypothetical protein
MAACFCVKVSARSLWESMSLFYLASQHLFCLAAPVDCALHALRQWSRSIVWGELGERMCFVSIAML